MTNGKKEIFFKIINNVIYKKKYPTTNNQTKIIIYIKANHIWEKGVEGFRIRQVKKILNKKYGLFTFFSRLQ